MISFCFHCICLGIENAQPVACCKIGKSQLDVYLEEPNLDFSYHENLDVLLGSPFNGS